MSIFHTVLDDRAVLRIGGDDRVSFLQNLLTQNIDHCTSGRAMMSALLTPQGKLLHDFILIGEDDGFLIDCDAGQADALAKKLSLYRLRADVTIEKTALQCHALWQEDGFACPPATGFFEDPRHEGLGLRGVFETYETGLPQKPLADWQHNRVRLGIAQGPQDMPPGTVFPLEYGFALLNAIDFQKGCFVGQEVTSRTHRKGSLRKKLHCVTSAEASFDTVPHACEIMAGERRVGHMVATSGAYGLALIREDALDLPLTAADQPITPAGGLFVAAADGTA